jgi:hypothetical protein
VVIAYSVLERKILLFSLFLLLSSVVLIKLFEQLFRLIFSYCVCGLAHAHTLTDISRRRGHTSVAAGLMLRFDVPFLEME